MKYLFLISFNIPYVCASVNPESTFVMNMSIFRVEITKVSNFPFEHYMRQYNAVETKKPFKMAYILKG